MNETRDPWAGIYSSVNPEPGKPDVYWVSFVWGLGHARGYGGESPEVKKRAIVYVQATGDGAVLSYHPPKEPLPHFEQRDFESKALELVMAYVNWTHRLADLVGHVEQWGRELHWATRRIEKKLYDRRFGDHPEPALVLQEDTCRILLEPVGRSAPGAEGVVDLYLMPAYDDIASLYFYEGRWNLHYAVPGGPPAASGQQAHSAPLSKEALQRVLEEMKQHAT
ncbi:MAG TPA: hypothetical protein VMS17_20765 [Gemmataceae bacterium]|nr:hypothetical protein [Gemmataceae bacterium]